MALARQCDDVSNQVMKLLHEPDSQVHPYMGYPTWESVS